MFPRHVAGIDAENERKPGGRERGDRGIEVRAGRAAAAVPRRVCRSPRPGPASEPLFPV